MTHFVKLRTIFAIVLSFVAFILAYSYLRALNEETTVVVAAQDIEERSWIKPDMLKEITVGKKEKQLLAPDAFASLNKVGYAVSKFSMT